MSDNFDDVNKSIDEEEDMNNTSSSDNTTNRNRPRKKKSSSKKSQKNGNNNSSSRGSSSGRGNAGSSGSTGGTATGGTSAGGGAATGGATGGTAAGGATAGGATAGGTAAGGGLLAAAWPVAVAILIIVVIIVIILLVIGAISFFTTVPGMMMDKITEIGSGFWKGFKSFFEGNAAYITEEDQTKLAEYIENMGYDIVGYGFASPNEIQVQTENTETGTDETVTVKSKYLFAYLLADYNTYALDETTFSDVYNFATKYTIWRVLFGKMGAPPTGMLKFDDTGWLDITTDVKVDRDSKTVNIEVWNPEAEWLNIFNTDTYSYNLDGWTGRYGKPLEFLLSLHISTMAPDLAYHVASDKEFDTKVHIGFKDVDGHIRLQYVVNSGTISAIKNKQNEQNKTDETDQTDEENVGSEKPKEIILWEIEGLEYLEGKIAGDGTLTLSPEDIINISDKMITWDPWIGPTSYDDDVVSAVNSIGLSKEALKKAAKMCKENGGKGKQLKTKQPYITYVEKAWYKNIYFVINDEIRNSVSGDEWLQSAPDFDAYDYAERAEEEVGRYDFHPSSDSDQADIVSDTGKGVFQVIETRAGLQITQKSQPLKGNTNPRIKELFVGAGNNDIEGANPKPEYYIYDGTVKTAELIEELRDKEKEYRDSGRHTEAEVSEYINSIDENNLYREIDFNKNSLTALTILENMKTEDADFILRDFKALLIELKYFKASDLQDKNIGLLDWIMPDYQPADWPNRKYEKQNYEYGTYIRSKKSMDELSSEGETVNNGGNGNTTETTADSGDGFSNTTKINNATYRNYKQYAGSYASKSYWSGTMSSDGCGPTAGAIVASGYGNYDATPDKIADIMVSESTLEKVKNALSTYNIDSSVHYATNTSTAVSEIRASLSEGKPVVALIAETTNSARPSKQYSNNGHFVVLLSEENGTLIMSNPGRGAESGNKDTQGLEAFVRDYMTDYSSSSNRGYLIFDKAPDGSSTVSTGFDSGMKVITPGIGEVTKVSSNSITIKFTESNLVKDMTMTIKGFSVDSSISVGTMLDKEQEIGTTTDEDIIVLLRAPNKAIIENVEEYMPSPNMEAGGSAYYGELTEDEFEFFAAVLVAENGASEDTMTAVAQVIKNRALDTVHFTDVNTITDVLIAPGQYGSVYKVPGSGSGPTPGGREATPPAGGRTYKLGDKGEYWVGNNHTPREANDTSRQVAKEVIDGTRPDQVSAQMGKLALYQVTLSAYPNHDSCCVALGELYAHSWGCLTGNHQADNCSMP